MNDDPSNPQPAPTLKVDTIDGQYTVIFHQDGRLEALRYRQPWRDLTGDQLILSMACDITFLRNKLVEAQKAADRYAHLREKLAGMKWADTPFEYLLPERPEDEKYITPEGLDRAIYESIERERS